MPASFNIPDYGVTVYAEPERPKQISPGIGPVWVDDEELTEPIVVEKAVHLLGRSGSVTVTEVEPQPKKIAVKKASKK